MISLRGLLRVCFGLWICCLGMALPAQTLEQAAMLSKAREAYYSLARERMDRFQCDLQPDWRFLLKGLEASPDAVGQVVDRLKQIQFTLTVNRWGAATITHNEVAAQNAQEAAGLRQIYEGMEQMTTGFFQTWSVFMVNPPLPAEGTPFRMETVGDWYVLKYNEGETQVEITLGRDLVVTSVKAMSKEFESTINPRFEKTSKGLALVGYQASYVGAEGANRTELTVELVNREVGGFILPGAMELRGKFVNTPFHVKVDFLRGQARPY